MQKLKSNDKVHELSLTPVVSNIGAADYNLARHLANYTSKSK